MFFQKVRTGYAFASGSRFVSHRSYFSKSAPAVLLSSCSLPMAAGGFAGHFVSISAAEQKVWDEAAATVMAGLVAQGGLMASQLQQRREAARQATEPVPQPCPAHQAGGPVGPHAAGAAVAGAIAGAVIPPRPGVFGAAAPFLPVEAPVAAVVDGAWGLGLPDPDRGDAQQLAAAVLELRAVFSEASVQEGGKEEEKEQKERRDGEKKRKKRKKKRSDSSSSGRSRSSSSSSGDREPNTKFPQWVDPRREKQSRKEITTAMATRALGFRPKQTRAL